MNSQILAFDLDKTLLHTDRTISKFTLEILRKCKNNGLLLAITTARSLFSSQHIIDLVEPDIIACSGGAIVYHHDKIIYESLISEDDSSAIIELCMQDKDVEFIRFLGLTYELSSNSNVKHGEKDSGHYDYFDFSSLIRDKAFKIQIQSSDVSRIRDALSCYDNYYLISYARENFHKISHKRATKEDAIQCVSQTLNVPLKDIIAFGDDASDLKMLQIVGTGVAVSNALDEVKTVADYICDSNDEDGVAKFIIDTILS